MGSLVKKIGLCVAGLLLPALAGAVFVVDANETTLTTPRRPLKEAP